MRWTLLLALSGCAAGTELSNDGRVIAEWHSSDRVSTLDPIREDVVVCEDGSVHVRGETSSALRGLREFAPQDRRFILNQSQQEIFSRLMRDLDAARAVPQRYYRICVLIDWREPELETKVVLRYRPATGTEWEVTRRWVDGDLEPASMSDELRAHLGQVDAFFRDLIWRN